MTAIYFFQRFIWRPIIVKYEVEIPNELLTWMDAFWLWSTLLSVFLAPHSRFLHKEQFPFNPYDDFSVLEDTLIGLCFIIRTVLKREKGRGREGKTKKLLIQAVTSYWSKKYFSRGTLYSKELGHSHLYIQALQNPILFQHSEVSFYQSSHTRGCRRMLLHLRQGNVCRGIPSDPLFRFVDCSALGRCL